jgi:hypothetical protein
VSTVIIPGEGQLKETAQLLLSLADDVSEVRTVNAGNAFEVPDDLADAYHASLSGQTRPKRGRSARSTKE